MASTLFLFTAVAAFALASVHNLTKEPIKEVQRKKIEKAISEVLPEFDNIVKEQILPYDGGDDSLTLYYAYKNEELVGIAVETYTNMGYSGFIQIMVGFLPDLTIHNTAVLKHLETPGLGDKMDAAKSNFPLQFMGKHPASFDLRVKKDGGEIDGITAATITARAFCDAVDRAYKSLESLNE
jgi:Na+-translocating ferredoxin:NAD+ oxidoreductase subunit G